jgi:transposase
MTSPRLELTHELVEDIPILMHFMCTQLELDKAVDAVVPAHGNHQGLSWGQMLVTWLTHILSEGDHHMYHVQAWADRCPRTLAMCLGQSVSATDLTDDRLAEGLGHLSHPEVWTELEKRVNQQMVRVYRLTPERVRLDTTTASVYAGDEALSVLFQRGHSKDHRPDLRQLKVMLAALDPLGVIVGAEVVPGNRADDGLYLPMIQRLQTSLPETGLLYIGDSKMGALATRAYVQTTRNFYLMPLAQVGHLPEQLAAWVAAAVSGQVKLQPVRDPEDKGLLGEGYEITRVLTDEVAGHGPVRWTERVLILHSESLAEAGRRGLRQRLTSTQTEILALTPERGRGRKQYTERASLQAAVDEILERHKVVGLLTVELKLETTDRPVRAYADQPARTETTHRYRVAVMENQAAVAEYEQLLGWRAFATNAFKSHLSLPQAVLAYREEWLIERDCARLKGRPLSLGPLWLAREDHAIGLVHLLTLGARVLALVEHQIRQRLQAGQRTLAGLYPGQPRRVTDRPTTERLLKTFKQVILTVIVVGRQVQVHLTPFSKLQSTILKDLGCPPDLYSRLVVQSQKPPKI